MIRETPFLAMLSVLAAGLASLQFIAATRTNNPTQGVSAVLAMVVSAVAVLLSWTTAP